MIAPTLLAILAAAVVPVTRVTAKRAREVEMKRNLRIIRETIGKYKECFSKDLGSDGIGRRLLPYVETDERHERAEDHESRQSY